jgi:hypothetical protein
MVGERGSREGVMVVGWGPHERLSRANCNNSLEKSPQNRLLAVAGAGFGGIREGEVQEIRALERQAGA